MDDIHDLADCLLIKVFRWLEIKDLIRCCNVCTKWRRVVYDSSLWTNVDLRPFRWKLDEYAIVRLTQSRFKPLLRRIDLSGFSLTPKLFTELESMCPNLKALVLENVTFIGFNHTEKSLQRFPSKLELLDLRYSTGDEEAFLLISKNVTLLKCFGMSNRALELRYDIVMDMFHDLANVATLDFSYCNKFDDTTLLFIGMYCLKLRSLALTHCNNVVGYNLRVITQECKYLKALSFSGTSITDTHLSKCNWDNIELEELDISWCRNITESGLMSLLTHFNQLVYLRLCSCGFGHAITDQVLNALSGNNYSKLEVLDVSYSREISNHGTAKLIRSLPALKQIRISCCRKLTSDLLKAASSDKSVLVLASFQEDQENALINQNDSQEAAGFGGQFLVIPDQVRATSREIRRYSFEKESQRF